MWMLPIVGIGINDFLPNLEIVGECLTFNVKYGWNKGVFFIYIGNTSEHSLIHSYDLVDRNNFTQAGTDISNEWPDITWISTHVKMWRYEFGSNWQFLIMQISIRFPWHYGNTGYRVSSPWIQSIKVLALRMNVFKGNFSVF